MTRMLGAWRTSGRVKVRLKDDCTHRRPASSGISAGSRLTQYTRGRGGSLVIQITLTLLGFAATLVPVLEAGTTLVVLAARRGKSAKLEVALVQHPLAIPL
jgi:hypothetical protein